MAALGTSKFIKAPQAQRLFYALQTALVDTPYRAHGKTDQSWDGYTLMYRNGRPIIASLRRPTFCTTLRLSTAP